VRVNRVFTDDGEADLHALISHPPGALLLPKVERTEEVKRVAELLGAACPALYVTIESAAGGFRILELAEAVSGYRGAITWGPYDLAADIGASGVRGSDGSLLFTYRMVQSSILLGAAAARIPAIDTATTEIRDDKILAQDLVTATSLGFVGKLAIHPSQVQAIHAAFRPSADEVARATRLVAKAHERGGEGVFTFEGDMIDRPMILHAERLIERENRVAGGPGSGR
jgi:citrate lyase subunit beta/citryl-CoA lyase